MLYLSEVKSNTISTSISIQCKWDGKICIGQNGGQSYVFLSKSEMIRVVGNTSEIQHFSSGVVVAVQQELNSS